MLSKFFIDRPIFATVLSVIITLTGGIALVYLPVAQYPRITPPSVSVSITYPGASAQVVADTVAAPIEQQVTGVPGMLYMSSQMGNDGTYTLSVTFDVGVDLNTALVMVQTRVTQAMPQLPTPVQNQGITIRKKTPDILCMINFVSEINVETADGQKYTGKIEHEDDATLMLKNASAKEPYKIDKSQIVKRKPLYNDIFLSNHALINVKDEILRVDGVSDVNIMGERDYSIRVWLDPQKMAALNITPGDVSAAVSEQNIQAAIGQVGQPPTGNDQFFQLPLHTLGRLSDPKDFGEIVVKTAPSQIAWPMTTSPGASIMVTSAKAGASPSGPRTTGGGANVGGGANIGGGANSIGGGTSGGGASSGSGSSGGSPSVSMGMLSQIRKKPAAKKAAVPATTGPMSPNVAVVRLKHISRVEMGALNYNQSCTFDGGPSVGLSVYQLPGTNALDVADRVRDKMKDLRKRFPEGIDYTIAYDTTPFIRESIGEVFNTLRDAVILVAIVVLLFLQDWRAMILPMIDVPVSLIGTFAVMAAFGYSLNNISLFGLVLAIGIVVDDAIVVLENIERQMAKGLETRAATIKAMEEISGPIMAITLVLCAVFVPCAFISGITGRFFNQFAVTIASSTIISAINALTMTPSRALMIFKTKKQHGDAAGGGHGHEHEREALPWWFFIFIGGLVSRALIPGLIANHVGLPEPPTESEESTARGLLRFTLDCLPGAPFGMLFGWYCIRPVNAVLGWLFRGFNAAFDGMTAVYGWTIGMGLRLCAIVLIAYLGLLFLTYWIFRDAPTGFVPQQDQGRLIVSVQLPDSASLARTQEATAKVDAIIRADKGVAHTIGLCGISFVEQANAPNFASLLIILKPFAERQDRKLRAEAVMARLRREWARQVTDARVVVLGASPIPGLSVAGGFKVIVEDRGGMGLTTLQDQSDRFIKAVRGKLEDVRGKAPKAVKDGPTLDPAAAKKAPVVQSRPMLSGVNTQFRSNTPQLYMDIDRTKVFSLGLSLNDVDQTLQIYLGSLYVNSFNEYGRYWQVTLQADSQYRAWVDDINLLQTRNDRGQMVMMGSLAKVKEISGPIFVKRYNLYAAAPVSGALLPGISSGDVINAVDKIADQSLPRAMKAEWTELMFMQIKEGNTTAIVFGLAVVCVFLALSALYESWTLPLAVILVVPLCMLSSLVGVLLSSTSVNIFVQIGLVVLVGLACKNAILVVEFAKELHQKGKSVFDATLEASRLRLRPILMTSFAFILGVVPLCVASGAGAEMRKSLGIAVFSGMVGVTMFGIFMTPVFFYVIQAFGETPLFAGALMQWIVSSGLGFGLGAGTGYLLALLGLFPMTWAVLLGGVIGVLAVAAVRGVHAKLLKG